MNAPTRGLPARVLALGLLVAALTGAAAAAEPPSLTPGQTLYVPVYSEVLYGNADGGKPSRWPLSAMLSIRNTDPNHPMTVRSIRYYGTDGRLVREYPAGQTLGPMATAEVFVEHKDTTGGTGANFLVTWEAARPINPPIVETVHSYFFGTRALAFTSAGQPLRLE